MYVTFIKYVIIHYLYIAYFYNNKRTTRNLQYFTYKSYIYVYNILYMLF